MTHSDGTIDRSVQRSSGLLSGLTLAAAAVIVLGRWWNGLSASLWLDETATHYFVEGSWAAMFDRLALHPQMSPGYYAIVKLLRLPFLPLEVGLRWTSPLAVLTGAVLLHRLALRLVEPRHALVAPALFVTASQVLSHSHEARPYAIGLLCVIASALFLVRLSEDGRRADAVGLVLATAALAWIHYTMVVVLLAHAVYALEQLRAKRIGAGMAIACGLAIIALDAPLALRVASTWGSAPALSFMPVPTPLALVKVLSLPVGAISGVAVFAWIERRSACRSLVAGRGAVLRLAALCALLPPVAMFVAATTTPARLFYGRYYVAMAVGVALVVAVLVDRLQSSTARAALLFASIAASLGPAREPEDWRGAAQAVERLAQPGTPIMLSSGYVEGRDPRFRADPRYRPYLLSPAISYPLPGTVMILPDRLSRGTVDEVAGTIRLAFKSSPRAIVISRGPTPVTEWMLARARKEGVSAEAAHFGIVTVVVLERRTSDSVPSDLVRTVPTK